jgi:hypothetical protein
MTSVSYIYAIVDNRTNLLRYVGQSYRPTYRMGQHCYEKCDGYIERVIKKCLREGGTMRQIILECAPVEDIDECEPTVERGPLVGTIQKTLNLG